MPVHFLCYTTYRSFFFQIFSSLSRLARDENEYQELTANLMSQASDGENAMAFSIGMQSHEEAMKKILFWSK